MLRNLLASATLALLAGCDSAERIAPVEGTIVFGANPVAEGRVVFSDTEKGVFIAADLDAQGGFRLQTAKGAGLPLGGYVVTVEPPLPKVVTGDASKAPKRTFANLPERFRDPATSPLRAIVADGKNRFDFDLAKP